MILIRFCLDWGELSDLQRYHALDCCRRIVRAWSAHGILVVLGGEGGMERLLTTVDALPQSIRKPWKVAIKRLRGRIEEVDGPIVEDLYSVQDLARLAGLVELVGTDGVRAELFGLGEDDLSRIIADHGVEISRIDCVDDAPRMQAAQRLATADIRKRHIPAEVWASRFAPLLPYSSHLVIMDRYCGMSASQSGNRCQSGIEFVLRQVWTTGVSIRVFMAEPTRKDPRFDAKLACLRKAVRTIVDHVKRELGPRSASLKIMLGPDDEFARFAHDRYLRFDWWICRMDTGLEPFSGMRPRRERMLCSLGYSTVEQLADQKRIERHLEKRCSWSIEELAVLAEVAHDGDVGN